MLDRKERTPMLATRELTAAFYLDALDDYTRNRSEAIEVLGSLRLRRAGASVFATEIDARLFRWHTSLLQLLAAADANGTSREVGKIDA
jgi:hypothetical protein